MQVIYERCAGLDVHKKTVVVTVMLTATTGQVQKSTRTFSTMTADLLRLPRVAQRVLSEQRFGLRAFFAALPFTECRGICDPLTAKNRSIERACEDTSAQKCISLRNPWEAR